MTQEYHIEGRGGRMTITFSSTKCGLLAIYFMLLAKGEVMDKIGAPIAIGISLIFAALCLLVPFNPIKGKEE